MNYNEVIPLCLTGLLMQLNTKFKKTNIFLSVILLCLLVYYLKRIWSLNKEKRKNEGTILQESVNIIAMDNKLNIICESHNISRSSSSYNEYTIDQITPQRPDNNGSIVCIRSEGIKGKNTN